MIFGALADVERDVHQLRPAGHRRHLVLDDGVGEPLLRHHLAQHRLDAADHTVVHERVEAQLEAALAQLLLDLRAIDLLAALVVGDLDPLALLHVIRHELADDTVGEGVIADLDAKVIEEAGRPETLEVVADRLFGLLVVGHPDALRRLTRAQLHVIEVGLRLDRRDVALGHEAGTHDPDDRPGIGRRQVRGRRHGCAAEGGARLRRRSRLRRHSRLRRRIGLRRQSLRGGCLGSRRRRHNDAEQGCQRQHAESQLTHGCEIL